MLLDGPSKDRINVPTKAFHRQIHCSVIFYRYSSKFGNEKSETDLQNGNFYEVLSYNMKIMRAEYF